MPHDRAEARVLDLRDELLSEEGVRQTLEEIAERAEHKLAGETKAVMAWEPVPLDTWGVELPDSIRSSWVFVLRANTATGAERHPNSRQRMVSYRGSGDLQTRASLGDDWSSRPLVSHPDAPIEARWISIPPNVWHQAVVPESNWGVVSFHSVAQEELIEERPDSQDPSATHQRRYSER